MKIIPRGKRVLLEFLDKEEKTEGGIYIPNDNNSDNIGRVMEIGSEISDIKVGDTVVYAKFGGTEIKKYNKRYLIIEEKDILGIIN
jgi:chaperonin GroES